MKPHALLTDPPASPLEVLSGERLRARGIRLWVKRDDLLCIGDEPAFCGNKWRKLQYNLLEAQRQQHKTLLTFGGAFSNHLAAVAQAGRLFGFQTIGIVRGERMEPLNPTLQFCESQDMLLHFISRSAYREKRKPIFIEKLHEQFGDFYLLPEGGTNALALRGCAEMMAEIRTQANEKTDFFAVACGTGGTLAGMIQGLENKEQAIGFSALKGDFLRAEVQQWAGKNRQHWHIQTGYHCGGYAKFTPELIAFINDFNVKFGIPLDPIYTGKLFYGLFDLIAHGFFPPGSRIVAVHTGGLQGIAGFNQRFGNLIEY
jgi:1-aminocyclopropane-1-carboxylate deaminase/D-cysteine desulfhydrase-like pyridoxal-dependent ACC family enzyme